MESTTYAFTHGLDYASIVAASEQVAWTVDAIFRNRRFDASKPIVPASWVRTQALEFLTDQDQLTLNHCRAFSYAHLNGNYEEFIPLHLTGIVQQDWHDDRAHLRALWRFGEDELRAARALTQEHLSTILGVKQSAISKLERRADMYVSTLRHFIEAMGGQLEIRAVFPDGDVRITQFQALAEKGVEQHLRPS